MRRIIKDRKILLIAFFSGFVLRAIFSFIFPLTLDEAWSFDVSVRPLTEISSILRSDSTSPVFTYLVHHFFNAGKSEMAIRWIFALAGFSSIFFIWRLSGEMFLSVILASFSFFAIREGSIARMHAFSLLFSSASLYFFIKTFERAGKKDFIFFVLFSVLGAYNFYPALSLTAGLFFCSLYFKKESPAPFSRYMFSFLAILLLSLPAFYFLELSSLNSRFIVPFSFPSGAFLPYLFYSFAFSEEMLNYGEIRGWKIIIFAVLTIPVILIFLKGLLGKPLLKKRIFLSAFFVSLLIAFAVSLKIPKVLYSPKYLICIYPVFICALAWGLNESGKKISFIISVILILWNLASFAHGFLFNREDWRAAASFAAENLPEKGEVLVFAEAMKYPFSFYYGKNFRALPNNPDPLSVFPAGPVPVLYIKSHDYDGKSSIYQKEIEKKLKLTYYSRKGEIEFFRYEKK